MPCARSSRSACETALSVIPTANARSETHRSPAWCRASRSESLLGSPSAASTAAERWTAGRSASTARASHTWSGSTIRSPRREVGTWCTGSAPLVRPRRRLAARRRGGGGRLRRPALGCGRAGPVLRRRSRRVGGPGLHRRLRRLLELADLGQRLGVDDVGHRLMHAVLAIAARGLAPPRRRDTALLAEERREDLRLLL